MNLKVVQTLGVSWLASYTIYLWLIFLCRFKFVGERCHLKNEMDWKEPSVKIRCGICTKEGHNRLKCPTKFEGQSSNNVE